MNKQELIEKIDNLQYSLSWNIPRINKEIVLDLIEQLDEPQKVTVPQFVADWIEYCKGHNFTLFGCLDPANGFESLAGETFEGDVRKCIRWCRKESNNFARAWLDGYEVEQEKRYRVKVKGVSGDARYLNREVDGDWYINNKQETHHFKVLHTRKELEEANFGWVFNCPGIEVEEVEE